jgi:hypothetical protein
MLFLTSDSFNTSTSGPEGRKRPSFTARSPDVYDITMKSLLVLLFILLGVSVAGAIKPEEIIRLIQLKTSEDVIVQLIYSNPLTVPLTPADVIELKKNGASERILSNLLGRSALRLDALPRQESESYWVNESARYYYTTTKDGERRVVLTNLDEKGNRMGPPPPPRPERPEPYEAREQSAYQIPPQIDYRERSMTSPYSNISNEYPSSGTPRVYSTSYYNPYFVPHYPGSSFGFHLLPQFTVIHPRFGLGLKPNPHCFPAIRQAHRRAR